MNSPALFINTLRDSGGIRKLAARWCFMGELITKRPLLASSGKGNESVDELLTRDAQTDLPVLSGSSIAGALRDYLCDAICGVWERERRESILTSLFGGVRDDALGDQSSVIVYDAFIKEYKSIEIRDGVRIDPVTGCAVAHARYDYEVLPPGTTFDFKLELLIPAEKTMYEELNLVALVTKALHGITLGLVRFGSRTSRGFGRCSLERVSVSRFDFSEGDGWLRWLRTGLRGYELPTATKQYATLAEAVKSQLHPDSQIQFDALIETHAPYMVVQIPLTWRNGLLIRTPQLKADAPDVQHLETAGRPVISGASFAGALRAKAFWIASSVRKPYGDAQQWTEALFGSSHTARSQTDARTSIISIEESLIKNPQSEAISRVHLDRFTQEPVQGALFTESVCQRGSATLALKLKLTEEPKHRALIGLTFLLIKEILHDHLTIGGAGSVGRGGMTLAPGKVITVIWKEKAYSLSKDGFSDRAFADFVNECITLFTQYQPLESVER